MKTFFEFFCDCAILLGFLPASSHFATVFQRNLFVDHRESLISWTGPPAHRVHTFGNRPSNFLVQVKDRSALDNAQSCDMVRTACSSDTTQARSCQKWPKSEGRVMKRRPRTGLRRILWKLRAGLEPGCALPSSGRDLAEAGTAPLPSLVGIFYLC